MQSELKALAERVMALTGPCRETDALIWLAVTPGATRKKTVIPPTENRRGWIIDETREASGRLIIVPAFTASLDAAMMLVPVGREWSWDVASEGRATVTRHTENELHWETALAATPALSLTAAALLTRAEQVQQ